MKLADASGEHPRTWRRALASRTLLLALVAAVLAWRSYDVIIHPTMRVEDGAKIFAFFHDHRGFEHVFRFKSGYMPLLPNLLGYLAVRLPPRLSPYFMAVVPTLFSAFTYATFSAAPFRRLLASDELRFGVCLALVLAPVGQFFLVSHTDFSIWNALFCAILWSWLPLPEAPLRATAAVLAQQLLVWTHPLSFVAAPVNAFYAWRAGTRTRRLAQVVMLLGHVLHLALGLDHGQAARALAPDTGELVLRVVRFQHLVVIRGLFGPVAASWLLSHAPLAAILVAVGWLALVAWIVLRDVAQLRILVALAVYAATAVTAAVAASKSDRQIEHGLRYLYVQSLLAVFVWCLILFACVRSAAGLFGASRAGRLIAEPWLAVGVLVVVFAADNVGAVSRYDERGRGDNSRLVAECMQRLTALHAEHGGPCGFSLSCPKPGDWAIVMHPPKCRAPSGG